MRTHLQLPKCSMGAAGGGARRRALLLACWGLAAGLARGRVGVWEDLEHYADLCGFHTRGEAVVAYIATEQEFAAAIMSPDVTCALITVEELHFTEEFWGPEVRGLPAHRATTPTRARSAFSRAPPHVDKPS